MFSYSELYSKDEWKLKEINQFIKETKNSIIIVGTYLKEKITLIESNSTPLEWGVEINLLVELFSCLNQSLYHLEDVVMIYEEIEEEDPSEEDFIRATETQKVILKAFSENIELCQKDLYNTFSVYLPINNNRLSN